MMDFQPCTFLEDSNMSSSSGLSSSDIGGIEATDLTSLLSQFEEASQSLDGLTPPESVQSSDSVPNENAESPVVKTKPAQAKAIQNKTPVSTPPATPPLEILERIRAKRKRKLAIMLPTMLPAKIQKSNSNTAKCENLSSTNLVQNEFPLKQGSVDVNSNYFDGIPDHDYCVNSPRMSPKRDNSCVSETTLMDNVVPMPEEVVNEIVIEAGDTNELNCDLKDEIEEGEVVESPTKVDQVKSSQDTSRSRPQITSKIKEHRSRRNYRRRGDSPVETRDTLFDKIPAYFTTLSRPSKLPKRDSGFIDSGIRKEDFIERDSSPTRADPGLFNKLPAYYSCFTNSTKYDNCAGGQESYDLEDLDDYPRARKPRRYRSYSRSRSRSRSYSSSRSRSCSRQRSYNRRRSYSSESGSSSSSSSRSRSRSCSRSFSRSSSRSRSRSRFRSRSYSRHSSRSSYSRCSRSYSRSRSRSRSRSYERLRAERKKLREEEKNRQIEERRIVYVGKIPDGYTRRDLRRRFSRFGEIEEVSVHFREGDDNYGFVTFGYTCDAYAAIEKGNDIPGEKHVDLCFGGRRQFCDTDYADLDKKTEVSEEFAEFPRNDPLDFDQLLKQAKLQQKRKR